MHKNPNRSFRPDPQNWADFDKAAQELGTNRQAILNTFIAWFLRRPDAELPERPAA